MKKLLLIFLVSFTVLSCTKQLYTDGTEFVFYDDITFKFNSDTIMMNQSKAGLDKMVKIIRQSKNNFEIGVHSGLRGSDAYNLNTTTKRAKALQLLLEKRNPKFIGRLTSKGYGESQPLFTKEETEKMYNIHGSKINKEDKRQNRRVVIKATNQ